MKVENGILSKYELTFLFVILFEGSSITSAFISDVSKNNTWLVGVTAFCLSFVLIRIYIGISGKYPDKTFIEINAIAYGKYLGSVVSMLYIVHFWFAGVSNLRYIEDFFGQFLFEETDITIFGLCVTVICIYMVRKGLEAIARLAPIFSVVTLFIVVFIIVFSMGYAKASNLLPFFSMNLRDFSQCVSVIIAIPFSVTLVFLMIFPFVKEKESIKKHSYLGFLLGGSYFIIIVLRNTIIIGDIEQIITIPSYQISRLAQIYGLDIGIEIIVAVGILFDVCMEASIFLYAAILATAQLFRLRSYANIAIPIGIISFIYSIVMYDSPTHENYIGYSIYPIIAAFPIVITPIITLIILKIKKRIKMV